MSIVAEAPRQFADLRGRVREHLDRPLTPYYLMLGSAAMLLFIGLLMVLSSSSVASFKEYGNSYRIFLKQLTWVGIAFPLAFLASRLPFKALRQLAWPAVLLAVILLGLTKSPLGIAVNGNRNWLALGPFTMQPSEFAKLAVVVWAADVYARKEKLLGNWKHMVVPVVPVIVAISGLVVIQRDLGTALILFAIMLGMLWVVGAPLRLFGMSFSIVAVAAFWLAATNSERRARLLSFIDPFADFQHTGYQAGHGILGMASGGIFGKGIGASQQKWGSLPEAHTDFIFAVLGEELGLLGTLLVLCLFGCFAYAALRVASTTRDPFVRYATAGVIVWLMVQALINIGMVLALLPVIGIPLPLVSYGGSALLPSIIAIAMLLNFARREPAAAAALARRRKMRQQARGGAGVNARPLLKRWTGAR